MITRDLVLAHNVVTTFIGADDDIDSKRTKGKGTILRFRNRLGGFGISLVHENNS